MVRKVLLVLALIAVLSCLVGCQTIRGLGRDIEWIGQKGAEIVE